MGKKDELTTEFKDSDKASGLPELKISRRGFLKNATAMFASSALELNGAQGLLGSKTESISPETLDQVSRLLFARLSYEAQLAQYNMRFIYSLSDINQADDAFWRLYSRNMASKATAASSYVVNDHGLKSLDQQSLKVILDSDVFDDIAQSQINFMDAAFSSFTTPKISPATLRREIEASQTMEIKEFVKFFCDSENLKENLTALFDTQLTHMREQKAYEDKQDALLGGLTVTYKFPAAGKPEGFNVQVPRMDGETLRGWEERTRGIAAEIVEALGVDVPHETFKSGRIVTYMDVGSSAYSYFDEFLRRQAIAAPSSKNNEAPEI